MTLYLLSLLAGSGVVTIALHIFANRFDTRTTERSLADRIRNGGTEVQCFSCGLWVPREGALEKKGRYFCGVRKSERESRESPRNL